MLSSEDWHKRFSEQAKWTSVIRRYLFRQIDLRGTGRILEVGCGTGAILVDLPGSAYGLDLKLEWLKTITSNAPTARTICADALSIPIPSNYFNVVCCHFFLLWVQNATLVLAEMARVTRQGGWVLALAEPDYGGRIDYPQKLTEIGKLQTESLQRQGADPFLGRRLASLFREAGLTNIQTGVLGGEWKPALFDQEIVDSEWNIINNDLTGIMSSDQLALFHRLEITARKKGERILYIPTFYAIGKKP